MGIAGTRVAQEAAGIIILDDNFSSIVTACKWGRNIYDSIRKFIQFQLTVNIVALFMAFLGGVITRESPLNSIQMLWVNLIMDTFASLALATEPPNDELLKRKPYGRNDYIVTGSMWRNIFGQAIYQIVILTILLFLGNDIFGVPSSINMGKWDPSKAEHYTIFFNTFVFMQIFNEINCRKLKSDEYNIFKGFCNNWMFFVIEIITIITQLCLVTYGGNFVKVTPLSIDQHLYCIAIGAGSMAMGLAMKVIPDRVFNSIRLFKEDTVTVDEMDHTIPSLFKRRASSRLRSNSRIFSVGSDKKIKIV
jgi:Ca2+ transporting ATPase